MYVFIHNKNENIRDRIRTKNAKSALYSLLEVMCYFYLFASCFYTKFYKKYFN